MRRARPACARLIAGAMRSMVWSCNVTVRPRKAQAAMSPPHDAGANHMHALCLPVDVLAEALQALLQEEDANQIACGRERTMPSTSSGAISVAVVLLPDIDDRVGRRVMFGSRPFGDLLSGAVGNDAFNGPLSRRCRRGKRRRG